jgi:hypothetical protein
MAQIKRTEKRLRQMVDRQWTQRRGVKFVAATFADPREAPGISTGSILRPVKLGEGEFHTLSKAEAFVALLALYCPRRPTFDPPCRLNFDPGRCAGGG